MLRSMQVRNFAIIDEIDIDFGPGMTVLTGETGAGKSILVDSLSLVLGERGGSGLVRAPSLTFRTIRQQGPGWKTRRSMRTTNACFEGLSAPTADPAPSLTATR